MSPSKFDSTGEASTSCLLPENGVSNSYSLFSEKAADGLLQSPVQGSDDHLVEFSEALRIVAKALRRAAEGKASAQAEAAEWKRKYELERARDLQMECKEHGGDFDDARMGNLVNQPVWCSEANEQLEKCCGRNGLCSDEVLRDGETDFDSKMLRKATFKLSWCGKGEKSDQHKHDIVSFERGNITTAERSSKQISLRDAAKNEYDTEEPILVLNEVTIDLGISSYLTNLECYCDDSFVTSMQGNGLILFTTSGSTAYSLAAGGSMVHPQVPSILFSPICPHSLSFRPLILPEHVTLRVQVSFNSRSHAWASFDGKDRKQLAAGDALVCSMAPWPVPTACLVDSTNDFLRSIHDDLHWNLRKIQSFDGPQDS